MTPYDLAKSLSFDLGGALDYAASLLEECNAHAEAEAVRALGGLTDDNESGPMTAPPRMIFPYLVETASGKEYFARPVNEIEGMSALEYDVLPRYASTQRGTRPFRAMFHGSFTVYSLPQPFIYAPSATEIDG